jgi:hypothetical protein
MIILYICSSCSWFNTLSLSLSLYPQVVDPPRDSNGDPTIDDSKPLLGDDDKEEEGEGPGGDIQLNAKGFKIKLRFFNKEELGMSILTLLVQH